MANKYYIKAILLSTTAALSCNVVYFVLDSIFSTYKSEWLTTESFFPLLMGMAIANALIFAVTLMPALLNNYVAIRRYAVLSAAAWFTLPIVWIVIIFIGAGADRFNYSSGLDSPGIFLLINTIPYTSVLLIVFFKFRHAAHLQQIR